MDKAEFLSYLREMSKTIHLKKKLKGKPTWTFKNLMASDSANFPFKKGYIQEYRLLLTNSPAKSKLVCRENLLGCNQQREVRIGESLEESPGKVTQAVSLPNEASTDAKTSHL